MAMRLASLRLFSTLALRRHTALQSTTRCIAGEKRFHWSDAASGPPGAANEPPSLPRKVSYSEATDFMAGRNQIDLEALYFLDDELSEPAVVEKVPPISVEHGKTGVFDVEELVDVFKSERVDDVWLIAVPAELNYADYLLIGTAVSKRHLYAVIQYINHLYKRKKLAAEPAVAVEGDRRSDWLAVDMGNVVVHLLTAEARQNYQIEWLWVLGTELDPVINKPTLAEQLDSRLKGKAKLESTKVKEVSEVSKKAKDKPKDTTTGMIGRNKRLLRQIIDKQQQRVRAKENLMRRGAKQTRGTVAWLKQTGAIP